MYYLIHQINMFLLFLSSVVTAHPIEHAVVFGNVGSLGYYYTDLWVGTPPEKQTVIVDTGSRLTAFPCMDCVDCGHHIDQYYNHTRSITSKVVGCSERYSCSSCKNDRCGYVQSYAEGSSISGYLIKDLIRIGDEYDEEDAVEFTFGCHLRETHLFRTQLADGIMGLAFGSERSETIIDALFSHKNINTNLFALCFGLEDGYMTVGGYNVSNHNSEISYVKLYDSMYYAVKMEGIIIQGQELPLTSRDFGTHYTSGTIVDSGTTFTYLASTVYSAFWNEIENICSIDSFCRGQRKSVYGEQHNCFRYSVDEFETLDEFFSTFPMVEIVIEGHRIPWYPKQYLYTWPDYPNDYCIGVYNNYGGGSVLGAVFLRGHDVIFDRDNNMIGFAESDCDPSAVADVSRTRPRNMTSGKPRGKNPPISEAGYWISVASITGGSLILVSMLICLLRRCKKSGMMKLEDLNESQSEAQ